MIEGLAGELRAITLETLPDELSVRAVLSARSISDLVIAELKMLAEGSPKAPDFPARLVDGLAAVEAKLLEVAKTT